jgi:hypothetical protein
MLSETTAQTIKPVRYPRKVTDGGGLYLLVTPEGHRYWRYQYRYEGKGKTLALGVHPDVSLETARVRHLFARSLLADGVDPSALKRTMGKNLFALAARDWMLRRRSKISRGIG